MSKDAFTRASFITWLAATGLAVSPPRLLSAVGAGERRPRLAVEIVLT